MPTPCRVVIKIGGSAITRKGGHEELNPQALAAFADMLACYQAARPHSRLLLVHGVGSFGHPHVLRHGLTTPPSSRAAARKRAVGVRLTQAAVKKLNSAVVAALEAVGLPAKGILARDIARTSRGRLTKLDSAPIQRAIRNGLVPVLPGDLVPDSEWGHAILSGDQLVARLGKRADHVVVLTDTAGILRNGRTVPRINRDTVDAALGYVGSSQMPDATGGMRGKVLELLSIGKSIFLLSAADRENVLAALEGQTFKGTILDGRNHARRLPRRISSLRRSSP